MYMNGLAYAPCNTFLAQCLTDIPFNSIRAGASFLSLLRLGPVKMCVSEAFQTVVAVVKTNS